MQNTNEKPNSVLGKKPTSLSQVKLRVASASPGQTKTLKLNKQKPIKLAQVSSESEENNQLDEKEQAKL